MRRLRTTTPLLCAVFVILTSLVAGADENLPQIAYVSARQAAIRSGPGPTYYPTTMLARGTRVEIYRHDPGGWMAVRPPQGSFSWVRADQIQQESDTSVGTVIGDEAITRVGTDLGGEFDVEFVHLDSGEAVEVLGGELLPTGDRNENELWLKISPPAGEFRWIHHDDVAVDLESALATSSNEPEPIPTNHIAPTGASPTDARRVEFTARGSRDEGSAEPTPREEPTSAPLVSTEIAPSDSIPDVFAEIDRQLSAAVAGDPSGWELQSLRNRATEVMENTADSVSRLRASDLLRRIERFMSVQQQYDAIEQPLPSNLVDNYIGIEDPYDGVGYLMPTISRRDNAPRYALTDIEGRILHLVSPAPGMNLHRYLRKEVGIVGQRGYHTELHTPHLTAERVIVLDTLR